MYMRQRLKGQPRTVLGVGVGACPACAMFEPGMGMEAAHTVVYRRSARSITMRCEDCGLQWTMTFSKIHEAMRRKLADPATDAISAQFYEDLAAMTKPAADRETRGRKPSPPSSSQKVPPVTETDAAIKDYLETVRSPREER